jgi:hypothetical protein
MPVRVREKRHGESGKRWKIINSMTGRIEGESDTKEKADASARARNAAHAKKFP